jgi:hypothetical protein
MHSLRDFFAGRHFGATFTGLIALLTFEGGIHDTHLLAVPLIAVGAYYLLFPE